MTVPDGRSSRPSLIPPSFPSPLAGPLPADPPVIAPPTLAQTAVAPVPRRAWGLYLWLGGVLVLLAVVLVGYFLRAIGPGASFLGMLLALIPLAGVLLALRLVDRWEPEPRGLVLLALGWGAIVSVAIALGVDLLIVLALGRAVVQGHLAADEAQFLGFIGTCAGGVEGQLVANRAAQHGEDRFLTQAAE